MKASILSFLLAGGIVSAASAQISFAPEVGLNTANMQIKSLGFGTDNRMRLGYVVGGIFDIKLNDNLSLQPGLYFLDNRSLAKTVNPFFSGAASTMTYNIKTLQAPVNLEYTFGTEGHNRFFIGGGPYIGYNIAGNIHYDQGLNRSLNIGSKKPDAVGPGDDLKGLDYGVGLNVGYLFTNGIYLRARYQAGLANLDPSKIEYNSTKISTFGLTVGYSFGGKKSKAVHGDTKK